MISLTDRQVGRPISLAQQEISIFKYALDFPSPSSSSSCLKRHWLADITMESSGRLCLRTHTRYVRAEANVEFMKGYKNL